MRGHDRATEELQVCVQSETPLTQAVLFRWHKLLLPTHTDTGQWKHEPNVIAYPDGRPGSRWPRPMKSPT